LIARAADCLQAGLDKARQGGPSKAKQLGILIWQFDGGA
jgi:hypothetical protein